MRNVAATIIAVLAVCLASSIIFVLAVPPISLMLFLLFFILATTIVLSILGKRVTSAIHPKSRGIKLTLFLMFVCVISLILQLAGIYIEAINIFLYIITFIFALAFFFFNILHFKLSFSSVEFVSLTYPLSIALIGVFGTAALLLPSNFRGISASLFIVCLSILVLYGLTKEKQKKLNKENEIAIDNPVLILLVTLLILIYFIIILYPQASNILGLDIARNFLTARGFTQNVFGSFYRPSVQYPIFGIYQSYTIYIVHPSIDLFQTASVLLSLLGIITFYSMAKQYLKKYDAYIPALATLIWTLFAGWGWLNFLLLRISDPSASAFSLIAQADALSYGDIIWRRNFFYLSMETSLIVVFAILYFLKRNDLSRFQQIFFMTILLTPLTLMHPYAIYLFLPVVLCLTIFLPELKAKYAATSLVIAAFASLMLNCILSVEITAFSITYIPFIGYLFTSFALIGISSVRNKAPDSLKMTARKILNSKYTYFAVIVVLLLYFASLLLWISGSLPFNMTNLNLFGYVPLLLYPVKLGTAGILAIVSVILFLRYPTYRSRELGAMIALVLLLFLASFTLATMQMQYVSTFTFDPNSWLSEIVRQNILQFREERTFELFKIPLSLVASVALGRYIVASRKRKYAVALNYILVGGLVSIVLISGVGSTLLGFEYYRKLTQTNPLNQLELDIINKMQNTIYANGKATIISPQTPISYLDFTGATTIVTEATAAWASISPELPLFVTRYAKSTPTYIYLYKSQDYPALNNYEGNYLPHLANATLTYMENLEVQVKAVNNTSIPVPNSTTALVVPYDESQMEIINPLSLEETKQYTVAALFFEKGAETQNFFREPIDYANVQISEAGASLNGINSSIRLMNRQTTFNKISVKFAFQPLDLTKNQVIVSKFNYGTSPQKSWEIAQYGKKLAFKISTDGENETVLLTNDVLRPNTDCTVKCEYDGTSMKMYLNNKVVATNSFTGKIFESSSDIVIGAELYNNQPTAHSKMLLSYIQILNNKPPTTEPIFYTYDLLSSMGLNFTTILSSDNKIGTYNTLMFPYDQATTRDMLITLETNPQNTRNVVIINTNGYGPILSTFGAVTPETFTADKILTGQNLSMQPTVTVPKINLNNNTKTEVKYANERYSSPLVMTMKQDKLTLIYVNIYPLLQQNQILNPTPIQALTESFSDYTETYNDTIITPWFIQPSLLFTTLKANGTINITSNSIASIEAPEDQILNTNNGNTVLIESTKITIQSGYGFYTTLTAANPTITLQDQTTSKIAINGNVTFLLRQPEVSVNGTIQLENFYMLHPPTIYTDGRTTTLSGSITLNIYVSDGYTIALPYKLNSPITVTYETPLMEFDEIGSFTHLLPYTILISIFAIPILLIQRFKLIKSKKKSNRTT